MKHQITLPFLALWALPHTQRCLGSSFLDIFTSQITHLLMKTKVIMFTLRWTKMLNVVVVVSEPDCASYQPVGVILSQNRVLISVWMGDLKGAIFFQLSERKLEKTFMSFPYLNSATFRHIFLYIVILRCFH